VIIFIPPPGYRYQIVITYPINVGPIHLTFDGNIRNPDVLIKDAIPEPESTVVEV